MIYYTKPKGIPDDDYEAWRGSPVTKKLAQDTLASLEVKRDSLIRAARNSSDPEMVRMYADFAQHEAVYKTLTGKP